MDAIQHVIVYTLNYILPNVLTKMVIGYYGIINLRKIKEMSVDSVRSMCTYNNILYVLYPDQIVSYDNLSETKKYKVFNDASDLSVDEHYIYTAPSFCGKRQKIDNKTGDVVYAVDNNDSSISVYNNKLYMRNYNKMMVLCAESGKLLEQIITALIFEHCKIVEKMSCSLYTIINIYVIEKVF